MKYNRCVTASSDREKHSERVDVAGGLQSSLTVLSRVRLCDPMDGSPLSMGFFRQEY